MKITKYYAIDDSENINAADKWWIKLETLLNDLGITLFNFDIETLECAISIFRPLDAAKMICDKYPQESRAYLAARLYLLSQNFIDRKKREFCQVNYDLSMFLIEVETHHYINFQRALSIAICHELRGIYDNLD